MLRTTSFASCGLLAVSVFALSIGCDRKQSSPPPQADKTAASVATGPPTWDEIGRARVHGIPGLPDSVTLVDGRWEGEPVAPGGASRPALQLARGLHLVGDLDGDGNLETVVVLSQSTGGTGEVEYLAVMARRGDTVFNRADALLGDRVQIRDARIEDGRIVLGVIQAGPNDAMCCPGEWAVRAWRLTDGKLEEVPGGVGSRRLSIETLQGSEWVLRSWTWFEPVGAGPEITIRFDDERITGFSACNRFFARVTLGGQPGDISLGPIGGTRMVCQDPAATIEKRFMPLIGGIRKYGFMMTQLALSYEFDGTTQVLLFDARPMGSE